MSRLWLVALLLTLGGCRAVHPGQTLPVPERVASSVEWTPLAGPLWLDAGPGPTDVFQGSLNDCNLLAQLAGLAAANPAAIRQMIEQLPDGTFLVTLRPKSTAPIRVPVDRLFPVRDGRLVFAGEAQSAYWAPGARSPASENTRPIWPMVIEKALAVHLGGYQALDHEVVEIAEQLGDWNSVLLSIPQRGPERSLQIITEALERGFLVTIGNASREAAEKNAVRPLHAYSVLALVSGKLLLRNPTGEVRAGATPSAVPTTFELDAKTALTAFRRFILTGKDVGTMQTLR